MRPHKSSLGGGATGATGGLDQKRRTELLLEARRKRVAWVEEARGVDEGGIHGARRRREDEAAENGRKAESELERVRVFYLCVHVQVDDVPMPLDSPQQNTYSYHRA